MGQIDEVMWRNRSKDVKDDYDDKRTRAMSVGDVGRREINKSGEVY